jgi:hypothetical protein
MGWYKDNFRRRKLSEPNSGQTVSRGRKNSESLLWSFLRLDVAVLWMRRRMPRPLVPVLSRRMVSYLHVQ